MVTLCIELCIVFFGVGVLRVLPTFLISGLLLNSGLSVLLDELQSAFRAFSRLEFSLVCVQVLVTATAGMLYANLAGLLLTVALFVLEYSKPAHSGQS